MQHENREEASEIALFNGARGEGEHMICSSLSYREALPHDEESGAWDCVASRRGLIINERIE